MNTTLFNITLKYPVVIEPQLMDFTIISSIILGLGIIVILIMALVKEYRNDKLIKKTLMLKTILHGIFYLLIGYLLACLFLSIFLLNKYSQVITPLLPIIIMITNQHYQGKKEDILFKEILEKYINMNTDKSVKHLEKIDANCVKKIDNYFKEDREFYHMLEIIYNNIGKHNDLKSISEIYKKLSGINYLYLTNLIKNGVYKYDFILLTPTEENIKKNTEKENLFLSAYKLVNILIKNQNGVKNVFNRHVDKFMKNKKLFQAYETYRTYPLGKSLGKDYEESLKLMNSIISETEKYLNKW